MCWSWRHLPIPWPTLPIPARIAPGVRRNHVPDEENPLSPLCAPSGLGILVGEPARLARLRSIPTAIRSRRRRAPVMQRTPAFPPLLIREIMHWSRTPDASKGGMRMEHLADSDVEGFLKGELAPEDFRRVIRHLVAGCPACGARIAATVPEDAFLPPGPPPEEDAYDAAIDRAWKSVRPLVKRWKEDQERLERGLQWLKDSPAGFSGLTSPQRQSLVAWVHVEILFQRSFAARYRNPKRMLDDADRAKYVVERIEKTPYGPGFLADLLVRAWAELANAYRVNENYRYAEAAFRVARKLLDQGTGDLLLQARIDDLEASLRKDQRRFGEACELHDEAFKVYRKLGERHLSGRALVKKGITLRLSRNPSAAVTALRKGIALLDPARDPKLITVSQQDLLDALVDAGDLHGAVRLLDRKSTRLNSSH